MVSVDGQRVLDSLPESLDFVSYESIRNGLHMTREALERTKYELLEAGLIRLSRGRGGLMARVGTAKQRILAFLPLDGELVTNSNIISSLGFTDREFYNAREELLRDGLVKRGQGRGGKTGLIVEHTETSSEGVRTQGEYEGVEVEDELYDPVKDHFEQAWLSGSSACFPLVTARRRTNTGRWSIPDVCGLTVASYDYLPGKHIELVTIEVKKYGMLNVTAVYETAAHARYSHKSYLVFEWLEEIDFEKSGADADRLLREARRFGIGLVQMRPDPSGGWRFEYILEPVRNDPDPAECNDFIEERFDEGRTLQQIRAAVRA